MAAKPQVWGWGQGCRDDTFWTQVAGLSRVSLQANLRWNYGEIWLKRKSNQRKTEEDACLPCWCLCFDIWGIREVSENLLLFSPGNYFTEHLLDLFTQSLHSQQCPRWSRLQTLCSPSFWKHHCSCDMALCSWKGGWKLSWQRERGLPRASFAGVPQGGLSGSTFSQVLPRVRGAWQDQVGAAEEWPSGGAPDPVCTTSIHAAPSVLSGSSATRQEMPVV